MTKHTGALGITYYQSSVYSDVLQNSGELGMRAIKFVSGQREGIVTCVALNLSSAFKIVSVASVFAVVRH